MLFIIYKIINKQVYQFTVCPPVNAVQEDLIPGLFFKKLQSANNLIEIDPFIIIERFSQFEELLFEIKNASFFVYKSIGNLDLIVDNQAAINKPLYKQLVTQTQHA